jgi:PAS domain S-box-containing protein
MRFSWLQNLKIVRGKIVESPFSISQIVRLLPGVYYRMELEPEFHVSHVAEGISDLLGYQVKELLNKNTLSYLKLRHPEHEEILAQKKDLCLQDSETKKLKYHLFTRSGSVKLVEDNFIAEYDGAGRFIAINGYLKEIKKSSGKLQLHNQLEAYRAAIDVNIISSITDSNGNIIYANTNFKKISKYTDEELLGKTHRIINSGYHPRSFFENMWKTISGGKMWQGEILNRAKDGSCYWVDTVIIPTFDAGNKITSYLSLCMLITERKHGEEQREKYMRVLEQIAHDLRGPVCSILGLVNIFEKTDCRNQDAKQATDYLIYSANKLDQISRDLSARIYAADLEMKGEVSEQPIDVAMSQNQVN